MQAISIKQPYAGLIVTGIKNIENRSWAPKHAVGPLAIVSSKSPEAQNLWQPMRDKCRQLGHEFPEQLCSINGCVIGIVTLEHYVWTEKDGIPSTDHPNFNDPFWWNPEMIGFILENPHILPSPIPMSGKLNLYKLPEDIVLNIENQLAT
jgi:hypothetical protein